MLSPRLGSDLVPRSRALRRRFASLIARFRKREDGVAAIEFGFIAMTMVVMLIGIVDISNAVSQNWRLSQLNRTVSDLSSQFPTINATQAATIFAAAAATMSPFRGTLPRMSIYNVVVSPAGIGTVCWAVHSVANQSVTGWAPGSVVTFPNPAMAIRNSAYIVTAADMTYDGSIAPNFAMSSKPLFFRPRQGISLGANNVEQVGFVEANGTTTGC